jgi:hypothetical protein
LRRVKERCACVVGSFEISLAPRFSAVIGNHDVTPTDFNGFIPNRLKRFEDPMSLVTAC